MRSRGFGSNISDWVRRLQDGEPAAEAWLAGIVRTRFERWASSERFRRGLDWLEQTDDLLQDVCVKLIKRIRSRPDSVRATEAELRRLIAWSLREVLREKRLAIQGPAGWGRARFHANEALDDQPSDDTTVPAVAQRREHAALLQAALGGLTAEERAAVEALFVLGLSYRQAADALGCGLGTLRGRIESAYAKLRPALAALAPNS